MNTKTDARETESQPLEQEQRQIRMARNIRKRCRNNRCKQVQYAVSQVFGIIEQQGCQTEQQDRARLLTKLMTKQGSPSMKIREGRLMTKRYNT